VAKSINLTVLSGVNKTSANKDKVVEEQSTTEYSSREVKPTILLLGDLLQAHSTFLLHHASSMSALFVRTRRSKFVGILGRYWDTFLPTWNVLMHGNPANSLYGGIKIAACGELGVGVGEEERGSGEREVLEGFVGRIDGLVDVIVSKFGEGDINEPQIGGSKRDKPQPQPTGPWLGSGNEPAAEDGIIFLGTGALSRKSLRDVSHWIEDLYRWGPNAYGVVDNPSSNRRTKKSKTKLPQQARELSLELNRGSPQIHGLSHREEAQRRSISLSRDSMTTLAPTPVDEEMPASDNPKPIKRPSSRRGNSILSHKSTDSESSKSSKLFQYLRLGYGTHWSLGGSQAKDQSVAGLSLDIPQIKPGTSREPTNDNATADEASPAFTLHPSDDSTGHYLIGLMGNIEDEEEDREDVNAQDPTKFKEDGESYNARLLLRTLTVELEREGDARAEADISIDLGHADKELKTSQAPGSEHTGTSNASFESQDRNKTKKLRVVVYVKKPFIFVLLFELRADALALTSLYRSLHYQIGPLIKPLLTSTSFRASKPSLDAEDPATPIYDLVYDPKLMTIHSSIPNIPDPHHTNSKSPPGVPWSRIEALNTHIQILNTYIATTTNRIDMERTCKTSRGWWIVWACIPTPEPSASSLASGHVKIPRLIAEDSADSQASSEAGVVGRGRVITSRGTSTFGASLNSGPAHPFLEAHSNAPDLISKDKEIFLIRRASDSVTTRSSNRFASGSTVAKDAGWISGPGRLAQGIGVDTKRYIESLLSLNQ